MSTHVDTTPRQHAQHAMQQRTGKDHPKDNTLASQGLRGVGGKKGIIIGMTSGHWVVVVVLVEDIIQTYNRLE